MPTRSAPYDMFLDNLSHRFVKTKKSLLSKYWDGSYYAYLPSVITSFSNPTSVSQLNYSMLYPVLSKKGLLRLGSYIYSTPIINTLPDQLLYSSVHKKTPQVNIDFYTNNLLSVNTNDSKISTLIELPNCDSINNTTHDYGDAISLSIDRPADGFMSVNSMELLQMAYKDERKWEYFVRKLSLFYVQDRLTTFEFEASVLGINRISPQITSTKFMLFDAVSRALLNSYKFDNIKIQTLPHSISNKIQQLSINTNIFSLISVKAALTSQLLLVFNSTAIQFLEMHYPY